jgi:hypothetical protein
MEPNLSPTQKSKLSRLGLTVLLEQGLTVLLEVVLVGLDEAIEPGEHLLGAVVSAEDDWHLVELFHTQQLHQFFKTGSTNSPPPTPFLAVRVYGPRRANTKKLCAARRYNKVPRGQTEITLQCALVAH